MSRINSLNSSRCEAELQWCDVGKLANSKNLTALNFSPSSFPRALYNSTYFSLKRLGRRTHTHPYLRHKRNNHISTATSMTTRTRSTSKVVTLDSANSLLTSQPLDKEKKLVWKDLGVYLDKKLNWHLDPDFVANSSTSPGAIVSVLLDSSFLSQVVKYQICNSCKRPVGEDSLSTHYDKCLEMKLKFAEDSALAAPLKRKRGRAPANQFLDVENSLMELSRGATPTPTSPTSSQTGANGRPKKKYKKSQMQKEKEAANAAAAAAAAAEAAAQRALNLRKKTKTKTKAPAKTKGPVDVEKQCGVPLPAGGFCARSLTCKTHSMGAKRAVPGRSAPYDVLLQQYQKRNQAKLAASNALAVQRRENAQLTGMAAGSADDGAGSLNMVLDPDEETHLVLEGLSKNIPIPLERKVYVPLRNRQRFLYMREAYANALITSGSMSSDTRLLSGDLTLANQAISGLIGGLQGRCALVNVDPVKDASTQSYSNIAGEVYQVRAPLKAILMTAQYNYQQQQLFQQQVLKLLQQQQQMKQRQQSQQT